MAAMVLPSDVMNVRRNSGSVHRLLLSTATTGAVPVVPDVGADGTVTSVPCGIASVVERIVAPLRSITSRPSVWPTA